MKALFAFTFISLATLISQAAPSALHVGKGTYICAETVGNEFIFAAPEACGMSENDPRYNAKWVSDSQAYRARHAAQLKDPAFALGERLMSGRALLIVGDRNHPDAKLCRRYGRKCDQLADQWVNQNSFSLMLSR